VQSPHAAQTYNLYSKGSLSVPDLTGKTAIVTGGAVRIGRALALALAGEGAQIVLHYWHSERQARETLDEIAALGTRGVAVRADLREPCDAARTVVEAAVAEFGRADVLVNNAAIFEPGTLATTTGPQWDRHFAINLKAPFFLSQAFVERLGAGRRGHIVNIADWRGTRPDPDYLAYTLTKAALVALTANLARQLGPDVQVNAIAPGAILPPHDRDESYLAERAQRLPLRRSGSTDEVARTLLFLLRSEFITGEVVHVTGGEHL
jgi:pteridine reductase